MPKLICGWCYKEFDKKITAGKSGDRDIIICPHCGRTLPSSKKQLEEDSGRKHTHKEWKDGDII
ncbi:MAG TPA: hypothetical protein ENH46_00680 [Candidatus Pacearchaeota archaeon]|nr:hypothetical protein [Candidatus Pacearchaeota archaeon]